MWEELPCVERSLCVVGKLRLRRLRRWHEGGAQCVWGGSLNVWEEPLCVACKRARCVGEPLCVGGEPWRGRGL